VRSDRDRQPEVADQHAAVGGDEAVRRLDVAMQDADRRRRVEAGDHLQHDVDRRGLRHRLARLDQVLQRARRRQLHRDDEKALHLRGAEHVDGVGMAERRGQPSFLQEAGALLVVADAAAEDLDRHAAAAVAFLGLVDLPHPALADRAHDLVRTELLAGTEEKRQIGGDAGRGRRERPGDAVGRPQRAKIRFLRARVVVGASSVHSVSRWKVNPIPSGSRGTAISAARS
jgi:hypothetical protein